MAHPISNSFIRTGCSLYILGALFLCSFVVVFAKIQADHFWDGAVHVEGVVIAIDAETVRQGTIGSRRRIASEKVQFSYPVDAQTFHHRQHFSYDTSFYVGQIVPVIYLPNTPWTAEILVDKTIDPAIVVVTVVGIIVLSGLTIAVYKHPTRNKQKHRENSLV